jgi:NAD(P)-dependent dehydrogenase (short-subunit alcohol dehydrogenase family)
VSDVALVTGATRGIGRATVAWLLSHGRRVVAVARDQAALEELSHEHPGKVMPLPFDLSDTERLGQLVAEAEAFAPVDELVCCAGIVRYAAVGQVREDDLRAQLDVNFIAPFLLSQALGTRMRARGRGAIVLVASTLGVVAAPLTSAYAASKAALIQTARAFAIELAPSVRVNAIAPGVVDTDMVRVPRTEDAASGEARERLVEAELSRLAHMHPLGRLGTAAEVACAIGFVLDASWMTGSVLTLDGGLLAR